MPSGSHGGSGGSHSSGGASSGGSWGGGSSRSGGGSSRPPRPMNIWFFGRYYHISAGNSSKVTKFMPFIIFSLFLIFVAVVLLLQVNSQIEKIKVDRTYYLDMIENALNDSDYIKDGVITDKFYNEDCKKWYFTYTIITNDGEELDGYTYSVYTREEINQFYIGQHLNFAVNSKIVTLNTDSINMEYKGIPLENDGEYIVALETKTATIVVICVFSALIALFIVLTILRIKKYSQKTAFDSSNAKNITNDEDTYCRYCGSRIRNGYDKCEHCGASLGKKK